MKTKTAIVVFSGRGQTTEVNTGSARCQLRLEKRYDSRSDVQVFDLQQWDCNVKALAAMLLRREFTDVVIIGYSWGVGRASVLFSQECIKRGLTVRLVLTCDGVYRPTWLPVFFPVDVLAFRALLPWSVKIKFPDAVRKLKGIRQTNDLPAGHSMKIGKKIYTPSRIRSKTISHQNIDDSPQWHKLVDTELGGLLGWTRG